MYGKELFMVNFIKIFKKLLEKLISSIFEAIHFKFTK